MKGHADLSTVFSGSSRAVACPCEGRAGRRSSLFSGARSGGSVRPERFRQARGGRGRAAALRSADDAEDLAVRVRRERAHDAQARAAHPRRPGLPIPGRRGHAGPQDAERVPSSASRCDHGDVHRGAAVFAAGGDGAAGHGGDRLDAGEGVGVADRLLRREQIERELRRRSNAGSGSWTTIRIAIRERAWGRSRSRSCASN